MSCKCPTLKKLLSLNSRDITSGKEFIRILKAKKECIHLTKLILEVNEYLGTDSIDRIMKSQENGDDNMKAITAYMYFIHDYNTSRFPNSSIKLFETRILYCNSF